MMDLEKLNYFHGIKVKRDSIGVFLSQQEYVFDLLHKFHLHIVKPVITPSAAHTLLSLTNGELLADPSEYHTMINALQYLTMTHPNIAYAVHVYSY